MIKVEDQQLDTTILEIVNKLKDDLKANNIQLIAQTRDLPDNVMISCPYHKNGQEKRPSAGIKKTDGMFHCFACGEVHSLPEVISNCFGYTDGGVFGHNWLLQNFILSEAREFDLDLDRNKEIDEPQYVTEEELDKYRYVHPYWAKRKITNEYLIDLFDLGYDKETRCITFPVRDEKGNCLFVARRSVDTKYFNYPKGVKKPLYGLYEYNRTVSEISKGVAMMRLPPTLLDKLNELIVCESMLDALTCWQYGKFAVALNGLGDEYQYELLKKVPVRKLILATDNDVYGAKARRMIKAGVNNKIIVEYVIPNGKKDINDLTKEEFDNLIEVF